jgi:hypothetical protein
MKSNLSQAAVMNIDKGEEIVGGWATPHIPQIGIYKLLVKKRKDGKMEWAHFVQRDNGLKERVTRGELNGREQLDELLEITSRNLKKFFGVELKAAEYEVRTLDGRKASDTRH